MIKSNFNEEYKAPKCKVVALSLGAPCLSVTSPESGTKPDDIEGDDVKDQTSNWGFNL